MTLEFQPWPKIGRYRQNITITEKIDGTNGQIVFAPDGELLVGSRKRQIWPNIMAGKGSDNFSFAHWVYENKDALFEFLGEGRHYGEWFGAGIQRGYRLDTKHFALFNTNRFGPGRQEIPYELEAIGLTAVPVLFTGEGSDERVSDAMELLAHNGSAVNDYHDPEGIIVYHHNTRTYSKKTFEYDKGKWNER